ncbi:DUF4041 domain-containing protein [Mammaliicoccus sciuri]|uniref:DUF4041 domain-containing protein n=1 Tax=Mammaliicoccus sciuri TaxID=1296 RepID=UPI000E68F85E|nr:DUF4041 domain-containing protein [Mammaliicoccus sciuri]RIO07377.1 DUF4041 domain-containing protein [Mammaliicoccus sciuri]
MSKITVKWHIWVSVITSFFAIFTPFIAIIPMGLLIYHLISLRSVKKNSIKAVKTVNEMQLMIDQTKLELKKAKKDREDEVNNVYKEHEERLKKLEEEKSIEFKTLETKSKALKALIDEQTERNSKLLDIKKDIESNIIELETKIKELEEPSSIDDLFIDDFDEIDSTTIKNKLQLLQVKKKENKDNLVKMVSFDTSKSFKNSQKKQITKLFETELKNIFNNLTIRNADNKRKNVIRVYEQLNKMFEVDSCSLTNEYLEFALDEFKLRHSELVKKEEEKEFKKAAKEAMLEEQKVERELEARRKEIEKEEKKFNNRLRDLERYLAQSNDTIKNELYIEQIAELKSNLEEIEETKKDIENRALNTRAGYVYIISNIGSFGEDVYKIGLTRRLEPMDRVNELSSASVPFKFDVHAMIFSEDAPALENILHKNFRDRAINKINERKEFFNVSLEEVRDVVNANFDKTVDFVMSPMAEDYYASLELTKEVS